MTGELNFGLVNTRVGSGHWGLPKGYVDEGELPRDAALRELREECSVDGVVTGIYAVRENLTDIGPAIFIAYSVDLLPGQIPKAASEIDEVKFVGEKDSDWFWILAGVVISAEAVLEMLNEKRKRKE